MGVRSRTKLIVVVASAILLSHLCAAVRAGQNSQKTEIRMWLAWPDRGIEAGLREWERRNPAYVVTTSTYLKGQDPQKLMTSIAGGNPPQLIVQDRSMVGEWACRGAFAELDERLAQAGVRAEDFYPAA